MRETGRFPANHLVRYEQTSTLVAGEKYILVMGHLKAPGQFKPEDFALRAKICRDGAEAYPFREAELRALKTDREFYWTVTDEGEGKISLKSDFTNRYLNLNENGMMFSRKKQALTVKENGGLFRFGWQATDGTVHWIRASVREESPFGFVFTTGQNGNASSFALAKRVWGIAKDPRDQQKLTVGTYADIHVDYGIQLFRPYLRKGAIEMAKKYALRYDLDALIMCGDNISDNGSWKSYPRGGAMQGKWPYERWLKTRNLLHETLQKSFRNPANKGNIFHLTGNHEYQCGDRQPEGKTYNAAYYTDLLPADILHPMVQQVEVGLGSDQCLLCYEYRVKGFPFLVLNTPVYPLIPGNSMPERPNPAHTLAQIDWLEERLTEIERELGNKAVIFVSSHFPIRPNQYGNTANTVAPNYDAYIKINRVLSRFPNLFFFYGHTHGGDIHPTFTRTCETMETDVPVELGLAEADGKPILTAQEDPERGRFRSDILETEGYHHLYGGSLSYYANRWFANDGKKKNSPLTHIEVPFFQGVAVEVYQDRVVLTMNNFGTKAGVTDYLPGAKYKIEPLVCLLKK